MRASAILLCLSAALVSCKKATPPAAPKPAPVAVPAVLDAGRVKVDVPTNNVVASRVVDAGAKITALNVDAGRDARVARPLPPPVAREIPEVPKEQDKGDVTVVYEAPKDRSLAWIPERLKASGEYEKIAKDLNDSFAFPTTLTISFESCDEPNAFYSPDDHKIAMCYELIDKYYAVFKEEDASEEDDQKTFLNAGLAVFFHELGHAMVHLFELPVTGKEEDAVDAFSMVVLMQSGTNGEDAALSAVDQFAVDADEEEQEGLDKLAFWDEHSLSIQRYYNMACLVYGSDPEKFGNLVGSKGLPEERAERCIDEYNQAATSWDRLLAPWFRPGFEPSDRHVDAPDAPEAPDAQDSQDD